MEKVLAVIVTYHPDEEMLKRNVAAIIDSVDKILIWENSPEINIHEWFNDSKITYKTVERNVGISKALNYGWLYSKSEGYDYLLTMDQDSQFYFLDRFLRTSLSIDGGEDKIFGPVVTRNGNETASDTITELSISQYLITSGMLIPIKLLDAIGGYCEDFMIDGIDVDLCVRAQEYGYKIYRNGNGVMLQHFGEPYIRRFCGKEYVCPNYSPFRLYGIFRNHMIVYRRTHRAYVKKLVKIYFFHFVPRIVLWENNKVKKLWAITKGVIDGIIYKI